MEYIKKAQPRSNDDEQRLISDVCQIVSDIRKFGDEAVVKYNLKFDECGRKTLRVTRDEIELAYKSVPAQQIENMKKAKANIEAFAKEQRRIFSDLEFSPKPGVYLGHRVIPVDSCLCYVPGGSYPLYSTALMLAVPAKVAGVGRVVACSPPMHGQESIHPSTLVAMDIAGVDEIYVLGGAHAIAAFAYGTEQLPRVDLAVGPGNQYVTEAKRQCYGQLGIDFLAGPSEVMIIADGSANPKIIAADILAQSEHDVLAKGILLTTDSSLAHGVINQVEEQLKSVEHPGIANTSWERFGEVILVKDMDEAVACANQWAPEHLELMLDNPDEIIPKLTNYGSLFIGQETAEVFGDYASGTNHTLPTLGAARYTGGVWVGTFLKVCTHQRLEKEAMNEMANLVSSMAKGENLVYHARAAEIRNEL